MILAMAAMLLYRCLADKAPTAETFFTVSQTLPYVYLAFKSRKNGSLSYQMLKVSATRIAIQCLMPACSTHTAC